jgi:hypothetical protein
VRFEASGYLRHGRAFVTKARTLALSEKLHWDPKKALPFWNGVSKSERGREKQKFCEQIGAFARTAFSVLYPVSTSALEPFFR